MATNVCREPQCEYFNRPLPDNAKVCPCCGSALSNGVSPPQNYPKPPVPSRPPRPVLKLVHTPSGREFYFSEEDGYIGRRGQTNKIIPKIDVTGISHEGIVSRTHARVYWDRSQNAYMIVDSESRNGTFLNGMPLKRGDNYPLNHGDSLQLGQDNLVCFTVSIN